LAEAASEWAEYTNWPVTVNHPITNALTPKSVNPSHPVLNLPKSPTDIIIRPINAKAPPRVN
jgi:hypothetical protein